MVSRFLMQSSSFVGQFGRVPYQHTLTTDFINMCSTLLPHNAIPHDWSYYHIVCKAYAKPGGAGRAWYLDLFLANAGLSGYMSGVSGVLIESGLYNWSRINEIVTVLRLKPKVSCA